MRERGEWRRAPPVTVEGSEGVAFVELFAEFSRERGPVPAVASRRRSRSGSGRCSDRIVRWPPEAVVVTASGGKAHLLQGRGVMPSVLVKEKGGGEADDATVEGALSGMVCAGHEVGVFGAQPFQGILPGGQAECDVWRERGRGEDGAACRGAGPTGKLNEHLGGLSGRERVQGQRLRPLQGDQTRAAADFDADCTIGVAPNPLLTQMAATRGASGAIRVVPDTPKVIAAFPAGLPPRPCRARVRRWYVTWPPTA